MVNTTAHRLPGGNQLRGTTVHSNVGGIGSGARRGAPSAEDKKCNDTLEVSATCRPKSNNAPALAYIGGTLGVLLGADILRLKDIGKLGEPVASIGGAGTFDGIFVTGIVAVLLT